MAKILVLGKKDIECLFTVEMAIKAVEQAYREKNTGKGAVWPMVFHEFDPGHADLDIKSGDLEDEGIFGAKVVSWFEGNSRLGKPALYGTSLIFDRNSGEPVALLNAGPITDLRTGAAGAVGAKYLARKDAKRALLVGCGTLAPYLLAAVLFACPMIEKVQIANPHHPEKAKTCLAEITEKTDTLLRKAKTSRHAVLSAADDLEQAVRESDIILTATPSKEPLIPRAFVRQGTHFSCVGADLAGKQEIDSAILKDALVFGDDKAQCLLVGECEKAYREGILTDLDGEIGEVLAGIKPGRTNAQQITVFDSTGIALQDLASAAEIIGAAKEKGIGTYIEL